jgi:2-oxo-4-hydroxy-4-carboxy-5-ureidoimidazoline decarboxylase
MTLNQLNNIDNVAAQAWFCECCAATKWYTQMAATRPFATIEHIENYARLLWHDLTKEDYLQAFEAHPMIGDIATLKNRFVTTIKTAEEEQSGALGADEKILKKLSRLNHRYLEKNGFIFIICATGLSAKQMLQALEVRIDNTREQEIAIAADHQIQITLLRIRKNLTFK